MAFWRNLILVFLLVAGGLVNVHGLNAAETPVISQAEGERNENDVLKYLRPVLKESSKAGRIYYRATCQNNESNPDPFPKVDVQPVVRQATGLAAVQEIFARDRKVRVAERENGIVDIRIGNVPVTVLHTRISLILWNPNEQFNPELAILAIEDSKDVRRRMSELGISTPIEQMNLIVVQPGPGLPHLPPSMRDVTVDGALDVIAKTFKGIVIYGACAQPSLYTIDFAGG